MAFDISALDYSPARSLVKRCVQCPPVAPSCPVCKSDEVCSQTLGDCNTCASAKCVKTISSGSTTTSTNSGGGGPNVGAIVGGVIGGVAFIAIVVFCIWKFWLKGRRHEVEEEWDDPDFPLEKPNGSVFTRDARSRASTHTVASMASTVLTRASNIIQIAYIPGVTNRTNSASPGLLVPPVPPIPIPTTPSTIDSQFDDQRFFVPGDLRDSTYSDMSSIDQRRPGSIAPSLARSSVATTVYRDSAVITPMPATQIISGKAAVVSVKGSSPLATPGQTPPVPSIDFQKHGGQSVRPVMVKMPSSGNGSGVSANSSIKSMKPVALNILKKGKATGTDTSSTSSTKVGSTVDTIPEQESGIKRLTKASVADSELTVESPHRRARQSAATSSHTAYDDSSDDDGEHERSRRSLLARREEVVASPFTDAAEAKTPTTTTMPKDALMERESPKPKKSEERGKSPFEDDNAI